MTITEERPIGMTALEEKRIELEAGSYVYCDELFRALSYYGEKIRLSLDKENSNNDTLDLIYQLSDTLPYLTELISLTIEARSRFEAVTKSKKYMQEI